jgi:hypothetical protein
VRRYGKKLAALEPLSTNINSTPESIAVSNDAKHLEIVFRNARLWLYDVGASRVVVPRIIGQGDVSAATFADGKLLVADRLTRVTDYELPTFDIVGQRQGSLPLVEKIYRYGLHPLYTVFPKPGELNQTVTYVLTEQDTPVAGLRFNESPQGGPPARVDVWGPVWSNLAFLVVVLGLSCLYVSRKDF